MFSGICVKPHTRTVGCQTEEAPGLTLLCPPSPQCSPAPETESESEDDSDTDGNGYTDSDFDPALEDLWSVFLKCLNLLFVYIPKNIQLQVE